MILVGGWYHGFVYRKNLATKENTRVLDKQCWVLEERTVCGVWIDDQLGVGQILLQVERIDAVEDDVGFTADNSNWNLDVL